MHKITGDQLGTWLDGSQGWHNAYRVVDLAVGYGFKVPEGYETALENYRSNRADDNEHEAIIGQGELSDMATEFLSDLIEGPFEFVWDCGELRLATLDYPEYY